MFQDSKCVGNANNFKATFKHISWHVIEGLGSVALPCLPFCSPIQDVFSHLLPASSLDPEAGWTSLSSWNFPCLLQAMLLSSRSGPFTRILAVYRSQICSPLWGKEHLSTFFLSIDPQPLVHIRTIVSTIQIKKLKNQKMVGFAQLYSVAQARTGLETQLLMASLQSPHWLCRH